MDKAEILSFKGGPIDGKVRVRFAPSPTGSLHVGGARTHLFNWLYARHCNGVLINRIEDTDQERSKPEFERMVMEDIKALDLEADESTDKGGSCGPYRQSERIEIYQTIAFKLLEEGKAYRCFCTQEEMDAKAQAAKAAGKPPHYDGTCTNIPKEESQKRADAGESFSVRMIAPQKDYVLEDHIRGKVTFKQGMVGDFILLRANGIPVYNFAVVIDDYFMNISHVIRAEEHMPNTLRQMMVLEALGWKYPVWAHISLVLGSDRKKLSKRHGAASVKEYLAEGYLPEALVNFLALLGWSPVDNKEVRPLNEIVDLFVLEKLTKSPAIFDTEKLTWMNKEYIKAMDIKELSKRIRPFVEKAGLDPSIRGEEWFETALDSIRGHIAKLSEVGQYLDIYYTDRFAFADDAKEVVQSEEGKKVVSAFKAELEACSGEPTAEWLQETQNKLKGSTGAKGKGLFFPLRACVTGRLQGPELTLALPILGKEEALRRADLAIAQ